MVNAKRLEYFFFFFSLRVLLVCGLHRIVDLPGPGPLGERHADRAARVARKDPGGADRAAHSREPGSAESTGKYPTWRRSIATSKPRAAQTLARSDKKGSNQYSGSY